MANSINKISGSGFQLVSLLPSLSNDVPLAPGVASAGGSAEVSRSDHIHPAQTDFQKATNSTYGIVKIGSGINYSEGVISISLESLGIAYGVCSEPIGTAAKTITATGFNLREGSIVTVVFTNGNTAENPTLNINNAGAKSIWYGLERIQNIDAGASYTFYYDGVQFKCIDQLASSNTYGLVKYDGNSIVKDNITNKIKVNPTYITGITPYPTAFTWTNGTSSGPTASITGVNSFSAISVGAIPSASTSASGIVTNQAQTFAGLKTFNSGLSVKGSANAILTIDNVSTNQDYSIIYTDGTRPIVLQNGNNHGNVGIGDISAPTAKLHVVGTILGTGNITTNGTYIGSTANSFTVKFDSGTTEGTSLYTFNNSSSKTINILHGNGITFSTSSGSLTINGIDITADTANHNGQILKKTSSSDSGTYLTVYTLEDHPSNKVTSLTGYTIGTNANYSAIATSDSLNTALGKLEYGVSTKQNALSQNQLDATNSGINLTKVGIYDNYANIKASKSELSNVSFTGSFNDLTDVPTVTNAKFTWTFTTVANTTTYTIDPTSNLPDFPTDDEDSYIIFMDAILLGSTDYTINPTTNTLTLTNTPSAGLTITVNYFGSLFGFDNLITKCATYRTDWQLQSDVAMNTIISVPKAYTVTNGSVPCMFLYYEGLLLIKGEDYLEVGTNGAASTSVKLLFQAYAAYKFSEVVFESVAPTISVGTVTSLPFGSTPTATITNSGTVYNPVLNFGIPSATPSYVTDTTSTSITLTCSPGYEYTYGELTSINVSFGNVSNTDSKECSVMFTSGSTATSLQVATGNTLYKAFVPNTNSLIEINAKWYSPLSKWVVLFSQVSLL